jgi:hypothetical protein
MFHRHFGELTVSASLIARTYKKHGVKFKYIQRIKKVIDFNQQSYRELLVKMNKLT